MRSEDRPAHAGRASADHGNYGVAVLRRPSRADRGPGTAVARPVLAPAMTGSPGRGHVVLPRLGLVFPRRVPFEAWLGVGAQLAAAAASSAWCLGDWLVYGQATYSGRYREAVGRTGLHYQTLRNYAWVAGRFELSRRRDTLSFGHHAEVAALPGPEQDFWLCKADEFGWSVTRLRHEVRASLAERGQGPAALEPAAPPRHASKSQPRGVTIRDLVQRFYTHAWNLWQDSAIADLLDERFVFRGSLGDEVSGRDGFRAYRDKIRAAFPDFHNEILNLVTEGDRAAARLRYTGHHRGEILGIPATGTLVTYHGAAFFTARDGRLAEAWVLGDMDSLRRQLGGTPPTHS